MGAMGDIKNWLVGGDATDAINPNLAHGNYMGGYIQNALGQAGQRQAPQAQAAQLGQATQLAYAPQADARAQMGGVTSQLQRIMSGQQAGAGELAVNRQIGQATAAQQAAARASRGANAALAARQAARNTADIGVAGAGQAAMAQMQDQQGATGQLGQMLTGMRGQDIDFAAQNAQLQQQRNLQQGAFQQQTGLANQTAGLQQTGLNDQAQMGYLAQMLGIDQAQLQAMLAKQKVNMEDQGHLGSLLQVAGQVGAAAASDRNLKTEIRDARAATDAMMEALSPRTYRYKDEKHGVGERLGVMAQDLQGSEMGREIVVNLSSGDGLGFDIAKGVSAALAGIARLHERLAALEAHAGNGEG